MLLLASPNLFAPTNISNSINANHGENQKMQSYHFKTELKYLHLSTHRYTLYRQLIMALHLEIVMKMK